MSTDLYEVLGITRDVTEDQIRKAYKKRALQTHPDRVPPEQKTTAEEEFRKVNNAYEILVDSTKRRAYDKAGVWPPPPPGSERPRHHRRPHHHSSREQYVPFPDETFDYPWPHHTGFTDPFRLFESIFGEMHHAMSDPFFHDPWRRDRRHDPHHRSQGGFFDDPLVGVGFPFDRSNVFDDVVNSGNGRSRVYSHTSRGAMSPDGRWVSESRVTRTVNGVTESVWKRRDATGNEYATYTYPDGRERHTVNGRDQITAQKHVQPQRIQTPPQPPPIQTSVVSPQQPQPYSAISRKRDSPTSTSSRKRDSPSRERHSPIEILSSSHAGSPPPIPVSHHYRPPPPVHDRPVHDRPVHDHPVHDRPIHDRPIHERPIHERPVHERPIHDHPYAHETPHYKSRWWKR